MEMFRGGPTEAEVAVSARQAKRAELKQLEGQLESILQNLDRDSATIGGNQIANLEERIRSIRKELRVTDENLSEGTPGLRKMGEKIDKEQ